MSIEVDLAIAGSGPVPGLVALALTESAPQLRVALIAPDRETGGTALDLVLADQVPASFTRLLAPLVVRQWNDCLLNLADGSERIAAGVSLLDPVQLWLQLADRIDPADMITRCAGFTHGDGRLGWGNGELTCGELLDLRHLTLPARQSEFVGAADLDGLGRPVFADLAAAGELYDHLQYVPLGDGRVVINRFEATAGFAAEKAQFTPDRIADLAIVRFYRELGELCVSLAG